MAILRRIARPCRYSISAVFILLLFAALPAQAGGPRPEAEVKAAFVYNFARFVEWPDDSIGEEGVIIGILQDEEIVGQIERIVAGKTVSGHPVHVRSFDSASRVETCHILFLGESAAEDVDAILAAVGAQPVLTVSHLESFATQGGVIGFYKSDNKLRFRINVNAARHAGLKISSKLLDLAEIVEGPVVGQER